MMESLLRIESDSPERTEAIAAAVAENLRGGDAILLEGDLGAGKTCFVRGLARGLGLDPSKVSSPSFVIAQRYAIDDKSLLHVDAYRVEGPHSLSGIDLGEMAAEAGTITAIEWPRRLGPLVPDRAIEIRLRQGGDERRRIEIDDRRGDLASVARLADAVETLFDAARVERTEPRCAICGQPRRDESLRPFCSKRCRLADLDRWFSGRYVVSRPIEPEEEPLG